MQNPRIEVLTSITGDKDYVRDDQIIGNAKWICYTDNPEMKSKVWEIRSAYDRFIDPRRNSRIHKIMIHKYSDADITIWIDGNIKLLKSPEEIVAQHLGPNDDMAMFIHGARDCIYDEAIICAKLGLDDTETIIEQAKYYEDHEFAKHKGLLSGYFIMRRNNKRTHRLNEAWWADYCRFSRRDQLSLPPAIENTGLQLNRISERWELDEFGETVMGGVASIQNHKNFSGNYNEKK